MSCVDQESLQNILLGVELAKLKKSADEDQDMRTEDELDTVYKHAPRIQDVMVPIARQIKVLTSS